MLLEVSMYIRCWLLVIYIYCNWGCQLPVVMATSETNQTCERLICHNGNACYSSIVRAENVTTSYVTTARCLCRGEWAGPKCELQLRLSLYQVTTTSATLQLLAQTLYRKPRKRAWQDLSISEATVLLWNLNISRNCLLLRRDNFTDTSIFLESLTRGEQYQACVVNGKYDSCSSIQNGPYNVSLPPNCVLFVTKLTDDVLFLFYIIVLVILVVIFTVVLIVLLYWQRHSLLIQLCLNELCCRNCYCIRQRLRQRRSFPRQNSIFTDDVFLSLDLSSEAADSSETRFLPENDSGRHIRSLAENEDWRSESVNSLAASQPIDSFPDQEDVDLTTSSMDAKKFLYENQNLISPLYSPQDHKVMTLTFIDDDLVPVNSQPSHLNNGGAFQSLLNHSTQLTTLGDNLTDKHNTTKDSCFTKHVSFPLSIPNGTPHHVYKQWNKEETNIYTQSAARIKHEIGYHRFHHHLYHKRYMMIPNQYHIPLSAEKKDSFLGTRPRLERQLLDQKQNLAMNSEQYIPSFPSACSPQRPILKQDTYDYCDVQRRSASRKIISRDYRNRWSLEESSGCYNVRWPDMEIPVCQAVATSNNRIEHPVSNTLPRARKPKFVTPKSYKDRLSVASFKEDKIELPPKAPQRPNWLEIPNSIQRIFPEPLLRTQEATEDTSITLSGSKSKKRVKGLISHFENNLSFLKPSKSQNKQKSNEDPEFWDLQSPLAEERERTSKKSRRSSLGRMLHGNASTSPRELHRHSIHGGLPIFEGHPSQHTLLPFSTNEKDSNSDNPNKLEGRDSEIYEDDHSVMSFDVDISLVSSSSTGRKSGGSLISSYEDDDTNLVTPFITEGDDSSDDDTYKDIQSFSGSVETLQDDHSEAGESLL